MSDAHGGGGGGFDTKFFVGIALGLALVWLFGLYRTGQLWENGADVPREEEVEEVAEEEREATPPPAVSGRDTRSRDYTETRNAYRVEPPLPPHHPPLAEHGVTYYLDAEGEIIDIYRY